MILYVGTHEPSWLGRASVPLFVSRRRLARLKRRLPVAVVPWALDSGGFTELSMFGQWQTPPQQYVDEARRWRDAIGRMEWAAIQDWMCEPWILAKAKGTVREHQARTIHSYHQLTRLAPDMPWAPVLQGWAIDDYLDHVRQYEREGVDLHAAPVVGVGSVCRRQGMRVAYDLIHALSQTGLRLHGFGLKTGFFDGGPTHLLHSSDSLAWSFAARRQKIRLEGCKHTTCTNCLRYAERWGRDRQEYADLPTQMLLAI